VHKTPKITHNFNSMAIIIIDALFEVNHWKNILSLFFRAVYRIYIGKIKMLKVRESLLCYYSTSLLTARKNLISSQDFHLKFNLIFFFSQVASNRGEKFEINFSSFEEGSLDLLSWSRLSAFECPLSMKENFLISYCC
jgi:hypothetical protein